MSDPIPTPSSSLAAQTHLPPISMPVMTLAPVPLVLTPIPQVNPTPAPIISTPPIVPIPELQDSNKFADALKKSQTPAGKLVKDYFKDRSDLNLPMLITGNQIEEALVDKGKKMGINTTVGEIKGAFHNEALIQEKLNNDKFNKSPESNVGTPPTALQKSNTLVTTQMPSPKGSGR